MGFPVVYHPIYSISWPVDHRFPMTKFRLLYEYLLSEAVILPEQVVQPRPASWQTVCAVHDEAYVHGFREGSWSEKVQRRVGMNWYPALVERTFAEVGGTVRTLQLALENGLALNLAGGTHHAHRDFGSGFCILNDIAVAAQLALDRGWAKRILIVDLDVHQGDGTAAIFAAEPAVFTFSMHGERNFPFRKQQSDCDIGLPNETDDASYLAKLKAILPSLLQRHDPDLVIYDAGVDVHEQDRLGKLAISDAGLLARDRYVLETCRLAGIPTACVVGGGYAENKPDLTPRHATVFRAALSLDAHMYG